MMLIFSSNDGLEELGSEWYDEVILGWICFQKILY